jgi:glutamyl-tRNA synthetase
MEGALRELAAERGVSGGKVFQPLRVALTGMSVSPGIFEVLLAMGRDRVLLRLDQAAAHVNGADQIRAG